MLHCSVRTTNSNVAIQSFKVMSETRVNLMFLGIIRCLWPVLTFILLLTLFGSLVYSWLGVISAIRFSKLKMSTENLWASGEGAPNSWAESFMKVW